MTPLESTITETRCVEAEQAALGAMLLDPLVGARIARLLEPRHFARPQHGAAFRVFAATLARTGSLDIIVAKDALDQAGVLGHVGGTSWLSTLMSATPTAAAGEHYAGIVKVAALRRDILAATAQQSKAATDEDDELLEASAERCGQAWRALRAHQLGMSEDPAALPQGVRDFHVIRAEPEPDAQDMLVDRLIARPALVVVFGPPQSGKSWAVMNLVVDLAHGGGYFAGIEDCQIRPRLEKFGDTSDVVLWVFGSEDTPARVESRLRTSHYHGPHAAKPTPQGRVLTARPPVGVCLGTPAGNSWLLEVVERTKATVVVLDTISSLTAGAIDVNKNEQVGPFMGFLAGLRDSGGGRVIFAVCHTRKGGTDPKSQGGAKADGLLGSGMFRALADCVIQIDATDGQTNEVMVRSVKAKDVQNPGPIPPVRVALENPSARFRMLEQDEQAPVAEAVGTHSGGRPPRDYAGEIMAQVERRGAVQMEEAGKLLGLSDARWLRVRKTVQVDLLERGFPVVRGAWIRRVEQDKNSDGQGGEDVPF